MGKDFDDDNRAPRMLAIVMILSVVFYTAVGFWVF